MSLNMLCTCTPIYIATGITATNKDNRKVDESISGNFKLKFG